MEEAVFLNPRRRPAVIAVTKPTTVSTIGDVILGKRRKVEVHEGYRSARNRRKITRKRRKGKRFTRATLSQSSVVLDTSNPTPNLVPVTTQRILRTLPGLKRPREGEIVPTAQVLLPKRLKTQQRSKKSETKLQVSMPISVRGKLRRVRSTVKVRPVVHTGPGIGVRTIDVEFPGTTSDTNPQILQDIVEAPLPGFIKPAKSVSFNSAVEVINPENVPLPLDSEWDTVEMARPFKGRQYRRVKKFFGPANTVVPMAVYHPTIRHSRSLPPRIITAPQVVYHPTVTPAIPSIRQQFVKRTDVVAI